MHLSRNESASESQSARHNRSVIAGAARGMRIAVVVSSYHEGITGAMRDVAVKSFLAAGGAEGDIEVRTVPGSFELIAVCNAFARRGDVDAVVALGCILTGQTTHDQYIAHAVATGLANIVVQTGVPVAFGVLTCQNVEQARERAGGGRGNKGEEAMIAAIESAVAVRSISEHSGALL